MSQSRLVAILAGVIVLVPLLFCALPELGERFIGIEGVDYYGTLWFYWSVATGQGPELFFFPFGQTIHRYNGGNLLDAALAAPLRWALGPVLGFNVFLLVVLGFNGWGFSRLARAFTDDRLAVVVASLLFATTPFALYELTEGRPTQAILGLLPLFLLQLWRCERPGWRAPVIGGILLALIGYQYWFYAFFGAVITLADALRSARHSPRGAPLARHALLLGIAAIGAAPIAGPLFLDAAAGGIPGLLDIDGWSLQGITPPALVEGGEVAPLLWQPLTMHSGSLVSEGGALAFQTRFRPLPWTALVLVVLWWLRPGALKRGPWLVMVAAAAALATGPIVFLGARYLVNPVYLGLLDVLPPLRRLWWPGRAFAWIAVLVSLASVVALQGHRRWMVAAALAWSVELWWGGLSPMPTWDATIPAGYRCLAGGTPGAIIELPYGWSQAHLYHQTAHGRPILGGMLENYPAFQPPEARELREKNPWLASLLAATTTPPGVQQPWEEADRAELVALGFRYVVLQKDALIVSDSTHPMRQTLTRTRQRRLMSTLKPLLGDALYDDDQLRIWSLDGVVIPCESGPSHPEQEDVAEQPDSPL